MPASRVVFAQATVPHAYQSFPRSREARFTAPTIPVPTGVRKAGLDIGRSLGRKTAMKLGTAIAEIMKREGIEILCGYPVNHLIEFAANADIRPVMVRQERIGLP